MSRDKPTRQDWIETIVSMVTLMLVFGILATCEGCANPPSYATACLSIEDGQIRGTTFDPCPPGQHSIPLDGSLCPVRGI